MSGLNISFHLLLLFSLLSACASCQRQNSTSTESRATLTLSIGDTMAGLGKNIDAMLQDTEGRYWFATNGDGVYCYDGHTLLHLTDKHGLCSNYVWHIQQDRVGRLWFSTRNAVCRFDGKAFTNYTDTIQYAPFGKLPKAPRGLFFSHPNGVCFYDGISFTNFAIHPDSYFPVPYDMNRPYDVYCTLVDREGNIWFGTQSEGVCRYDGNNFTYLTDKDLAGPAVRALFQDRSGNLWFGNNGGGLYSYDGKILTNLTEENHLGNPEFLKGEFNDKPGSMARIWSINQDKAGKLWVGTIDAGVWKYDGNTWKNYTTQDGLSGNSIWTIYKDKSGELWFVTNGETVCRFNGESFTKLAF